MDLVAIILFLVLTYYVFARKRYVCVDPYTVFFLSIAMYVFYVPIIMRIMNVYDVPLSEIGALRLSESDWTRVIVLGGLALVSASISFQVVASLAIWPFIKDSFEKLSQKAASANPHGTTLIVTSGVLIFLLFATQSNALILSMTDYQTAYTLRYENATFAFLIFLAVMSLAAAVNYLILARRHYAVTFGLSFLLFALLSVFLYSKLYIMFIVFSGLCLLYRLGLRSRTRLLLLILVTMTLSFLFILPIYAIYRGAGEINLDYLQSGQADIFLSDTPGPFATVVYVLQSTDVAYLAEQIGMPPLWLSFIMWVPKSIWPDRPLDLAESFARLVQPNWQPGQGVGFSPFAEGLLRYGDWGAIIIPGITGAIVAIVLAGFLSLYPRSVRLSLMMSIGVYALFFSQRGPVSGLLSPMLQFFIPHVLVFHSVLGSQRLISRAKDVLSVARARRPQAKTSLQK